VRVPSGHEAGALDHARDLAAHQRHFLGIGVVRARGVQAHEAALADHLAGGVELLHAHVIEVARAMHGGARVGLRENEELGLAGERAQTVSQAFAIVEDRPVGATPTALAGAGIYTGLTAACVLVAFGLTIVVKRASTPYVIAPADDDV